MLIFLFGLFLGCVFAFFLAAIFTAVVNEKVIQAKFKHGSWIFQDIYEENINYKCSNCGAKLIINQFTGDQIKNHKYCSNCGAKRDNKKGAAKNG